MCHQCSGDGDPQVNLRLLIPLVRFGRILPPPPRLPLLKAPLRAEPSKSHVTKKDQTVTNRGVLPSFLSLNAPLEQEVAVKVFVANPWRCILAITFRKPGFVTMTRLQHISCQRPATSKLLTLRDCKMLPIKSQPISSCECSPSRLAAQPSPTGVP